VIATSYADLTDGEISDPIVLSESGTDLGPPTGVWTGTDYAGNVFSPPWDNYCLGWTSAEDFYEGAVGNNIEGPDDWTDDR
jgi:hypothetical protein